MDRARHIAGLAAGITVYRPQTGLLFALLDYLVAEKIPILIYVDGPVGIAASQELLDRLRRIPGAELIQSSSNRGIGAGLNRLAKRAGEIGVRRLLLLDQDSFPSPGLLARLDAGMDGLVATQMRVAAVGPRPVPPHDGSVQFQAPRYRSPPGVKARAGCRPVRFLITSGSLIDLAAFDAVGPFRDDYVMDGIDVEWCFRAWAKGYSVWVMEGVEMEHRVGYGTIRFGPFHFPAQNPRRMTIYVRNRSHSLRLAHVPLAWKLRTLLYLPLQIVAYSCRSESPLATLSALLQASWQGLANRLGNRQA